MSDELIVVAGALANKAGQAGEAWVRLNWMLGFKKLGYRVLFLEQLRHGSIKYFDTIIDRFGLGGSAGLVDEQGNLLAGQNIVDLIADAQALINISGHLPIEGKLKNIPRKVYVDLDPGFTQLWQAQGNRGARLEGHDFYFTIGENIGTPECPLPTAGIDWRKTRPPIVLDEWPAQTSTVWKGFSTIANWRGPYGVIEFGGQTFGLKVHEFRKFIDLPQRTGLSFEIALGIDPADQKDLDALQQHGWRIVSPTVVARPDDFRSYVQTSSAEFSVAQGIYVQTQSGWFSDRTAAYLASGKPALIQDTGFSRNYPTGDGLVAFSTLDEAKAGALEIAGNYQQHSRAARALAEEFLDSGKVLRKLLNEISLDQ
jgi:hypothetical protein